MFFKSTTLYCIFSIYMITATLHAPQGLAINLSTIKKIQNIYCVKNGDELTKLKIAEWTRRWGLKIACLGLKLDSVVYWHYDHK